VSLVLKSWCLCKTLLNLDTKAFSYHSRSSPASNSQKFSAALSTLRGSLVHYLMSSYTTLDLSQKTEKLSTPLFRNYITIIIVSFCM